MEELQEKLNKSQSRVFRYLKEHGSITSLEAIKALHETRLGARIFEMKKKGIPIQSKMIMVLFFIHARDGFIEKRAVLSIDELRETL